MLFSSASSLLGIALTKHSIRIAHTKKQKGTIHSTCSERVLQTEEQEDPKKAGQILRSLLSTLPPSPRKAIVLLPPEKVYTHTFSLSLQDRKDQEARVKQQIAENIPEETTDLLYTSKILRESKEGASIGIAAVRKDCARFALETCHEAGLSVSALTTEPVAIAAAMASAPTTFLLIHAATVKDRFPSLTLFHQRWPVDEAILPPEATASKIAEAVKTFLHEYQEKGLPTDSIVVHGDATLIKELQQLLSQHDQQRTNKNGTQVTETNEQSGIHHPYTVEEALPWIPAKDQPWGALIAASTTPPQHLMVNLLQHPPEKKVGRLSFDIALVIVFILSAAWSFIHNSSVILSMFGW